MRPMHLLAAALLTALAAVAAPAVAAGSGWQPDLIEALKANGAQVVPLGSRGGLRGYFVTPAEAAGYGLYVTGDGHAVAGMLYGPDGTEITGAQLAAARRGDSTAAPRAPGSGAIDSPAAWSGRAGGIEAEGAGNAAAIFAHAAVERSAEPSSPSSRALLFERSAAAFGFTLGERGPLAVLLGDAACPWSRAAAARLGREALAGRLRLHVVPVAVMGADAARRAAAIAASPDPARAWFEGPGAPADRAGAERIARNNALLDAWGADAVPLIAWRAPGGAVGHRIGDIDDVGAWLRETLGPETLGPHTLGRETGLE